VTHNLGVVARYVSRLYIMYAGRIVESGACKDLFRRPLHPYTLGLFKSIPRLDEKKGRRLVPIPGAPPSLVDLPAHCAFLPRCGHRSDRCSREPWPELREVEPGHQVRCLVTAEASA
jgi:oligopeptide/dipeptide ABC transporter ATP-binding protein